jgi:hypothetical protein
LEQIAKARFDTRQIAFELKPRLDIVVLQHELDSHTKGLILELTDDIFVELRASLLVLVSALLQPVADAHIPVRQDASFLRSKLCQNH